MSIKMYGTTWCPDCTRTKRFLDERGIPYDWTNIDENEEAARFVIQANRGKRIVPTLLFEDGTTLAEPSNADLAHKLGLPTT